MNLFAAVALVLGLVAIVAYFYAEVVNDRNKILSMRVREIEFERDDALCRCDHLTAVITRYCADETEMKLHNTALEQHNAYLEAHIQHTDERLAGVRLVAGLVDVDDKFAVHDGVSAP